MSPEIVIRALEKYGIDYVRILPSHKGYRNESFPILLPGGAMANLLFYKVEPGILARIRRTNAVSNYLHANGFPTRKLFDTRLLCLTAADRTKKYAALYTYLPGATIPWEAYTKNHVKLLGMAMSKMHGALRDLPASETTILAADAHVSDEYMRILSHMETYFSEAGVQQAMNTKLHIILKTSLFNRLRKCLVYCDNIPSKQALHMDFVRGNILFSTAEDSSLQLDNLAISGILDFEKAAYGHTAFDIARTLAFLLVDCKHKPAEKIRKYFLYSGYKKRGNTSFVLPDIHSGNQRIDLLEELLGLFLTYDFYKFLRHNPYESLEQNEHFTRTRDILDRRGVIEYKQSER